MLGLGVNKHLLLSGGGQQFSPAADVRLPRRAGQVIWRCIAGCMPLRRIAFPREWRTPPALLRERRSPNQLRRVAEDVEFDVGEAELTEQTA